LRWIKNWMSRKTLFSGFLSSYLLMLIIPVLIGSFSFIQFSQMINSETEKYNLSLLKQSQRVLDDRLRNIEEMAINLSSDSQVQRFVNATEQMDAVDKYNLSKLIESLARYKNTNQVIHSIYIYFPKSGSVVTETAKSSLNDFHQYIYRYTDWAFDDWKYGLHQTHNLQYRAAQLSIGNISEPSRVICLIQSVFQGSMKEPVATIVVSIDVQKLEKLLHDELASEQNLYVLDRFGTLIFDIGDPSLLAAVPAKQLNTLESLNVKVRNQQYLVSTIQSDYQNRQYVSISSVEAMRRNLQQILNRTVMITLLLFAAGISLALILARVKYHSITRSFKKQLPILRANLLMSLMKGSSQPSEDMTPEEVGISFPHPYFSVILVHVDQYSEAKLKERSLSKFAISNVIEHLGNEIGYCYAVDLDVRRIGFILNLPHKGEDAEWELEHIADKALEFIGNSFKHTITISIGSIHEGSDTIHLAYSEALSAMDYQIVKGHSCVLRYDDMATLMHPQTYIYPLETEDLLINSIRQGNINKVRELMNTVYEINVSSRQLSLEMARCLFFDMMGTAVKVLNSSAVDFERIFPNHVNPFELLTSCHTIQEMKQTLLWIYERICDHIQEDKKKHSRSLEDQIASYIQLNYADPDLSLKKVAGIFQLSPTYLSGLFKEKVGDNFLNYVNKLRVDGAKRVLAEQTLPLHEVASRVGYSNNVVLIRNFKKYTGMTPGEYRDSAQGQS
jgi:two-component system, response regulator YesN